MTLTHSSMRPRRWRESWIRSKPKQCISILALALTAFIVFLHSSNPFQAVSYIPDRLHNSFEKEVKRISKSDLASGRNANRTAKPRAAFVVLIRERQLSEILPTLRDIQWAFNDDHAYDYVFLSETEFTSWFKDTINDFLSKRPLQPKASFGLILPQDWNVPAHIDMDWAKKRWAMKMSANIPYAKSTTYRQMCRYMSGPVFQHPLLKNLDYVWRLEPETKHLCTIRSHWRQIEGQPIEWVERDPFRYMRDHKKKYTWFMTMSEYRTTVMSLMMTTNKWKRENPRMLAVNDSLSFVSDDGMGYNLCHYWSNFEIIDLSFARSPAYTSYFDTLDEAGGFFYERWGDAPVRSIAASMMLNSDELWQMDYAGYVRPWSHLGARWLLTMPVLLDGSSIRQSANVLANWILAKSAPAIHTTMLVSRTVPLHTLHDGLKADQSDYSPPFVSCRAKADKINGLDTKSIVHAINRQNGVLENFKPGEEPYVVPPPRLRTSPIL